jgi:hypothetical protein
MRMNPDVIFNETWANVKRQTPRPQRFCLRHIGLRRAAGPLLSKVAGRRGDVMMMYSRRTQPCDKAFHGRLLRWCRQS